ncbi:hypothetical protein L7F22_048079 [Adiantum nelumboides]|nr:hypothetical protein [Adiantum nelumboides]
MDKDFDTIKRMRWRYDKLLQPSEFVDKTMRDLLVLPPTRKEEADALKIRDVTHEVQTRVKAAIQNYWTRDKSRLTKTCGHWILAIFEVDKRIVWTLNSIRGSHPKLSLVLKRLLAAYGSLVGDHSLYDFEIKAVPVKAHIDSVSCGWRCILHSKYILSALFHRKDQFMGKNTIQLYIDNFLSRYRACIIGDILEVSQAKTLDNTPMFLDIGDIELMLSSRECGVPKEITVEERKEHRAAGDVQVNPMEDMECTREEAKVTVLIVGEDVPVANPMEINMDAPVIAAKVPSNTMEELMQTTEKPEVEISPVATYNEASNEQANSMEEVRQTKEQPNLEIPTVPTHNVAFDEPTTSMKELGATREEPELGLPPMIVHMPEDIVAGQEHPIARMVAEEPAQSKQEEGESKNEEPEVESETRHSPKELEHINKGDKQDQQSRVDENGLNNSLQGSPQLHEAS